MSANTTRYECEYNKIRTYLDSKTDLVNPCSGEDADVPAWSWRQHVRFDCACGERKRKCVFGVKDSKGPFESRSLSRSLSFSLCLLFSLSFSLPLLLSLSLSRSLSQGFSLSLNLSPLLNTKGSIMCARVRAHARKRQSRGLELWKRWREYARTCTIHA